MSRILFITPVFPDVNGSGRQKRAHLWLSTLESNHDVHLLCIQEGDTPGISSFSEKKQVLTVGFTFAEKLKQLFLFVSSIFGPKMTGISRFFWMPLSVSSKKQLQDVYQHVDFDKIICFRLYISEYALFLRELTGCDLVELDIDDIESNTWNSISRLLWRNGVYRRAAMHKITALLFLINERKTMSKFNTIYVCSGDDQKLMAKRIKGGETEVKVFPNKVYGTPPDMSVTQQPSRLLFIGSLGYYPNVEAVLWFIKNVFSELKQISPSISMNVAGFGCSAQLTSYFSKIDGVSFFKDVCVVDEIYDQSDIVISPLHAGGGTKLKVLEAMWFGLPVIGTKESVRGLALTANIHYLPADTKEEFIQQCLLLLENEQIYKELSIQAKELVAQKYCY